MSELILHILATWRLSRLLYVEDGPFEVFGRIRDKAGVRYDDLGRRTGSTQAAHMLNCFLCTSVWAAAAIGLFKRRLNPADWLAWSAGAILIRLWTKSPK